jgi:alginate O-acetyltransferase complex protein AlgI
MTFNSVIFLVFLAMVLAVYYRLNHRAQNYFLLVASYVFYGWWDPRFLGLLWFTSLFDYFCALWIERASDLKRKKWLLAGSVTINMGVLCLFKYFNFFADTAQASLATLGIHGSFPTLHVVLPVGISFYTFLSMSYTIDVYRGNLKASRHPVDFLLYVAYFPHLVAGPIVRASYLLPQCQQPRTIKREQVVNGVWLILLGYFKKVVIGDRLAQVTEWGFAQPLPPLTDANAWLILYAFAFQIYADFAGYTDIARGLAKIMGFELIENFRAPYLVANPAAFWRNWHISLSTWLRDYLYIPLGGNRRGSFRTFLNLMTTMLLGGLWHGAGAAFVLWGFYHGTLLAVHRCWTQWRDKGGGTIESSLQRAADWLDKIGQGLRVFFFFHLTCLGWLFFRAGSVPAQFNQVDVAGHYLRALFTLPRNGLTDIAWGTLLLCAIGLFLQWKHDLMERFDSWPVQRQVVAVCSVLVAIVSLGVFKGAQFIYFQF